MQPVLTPELSPPGLWVRLAYHAYRWRGLPWLVLVAGICIWQAWLGFDYNSNETTNLALRIGRASAYLLLVLMVLLWLPVARQLISFCYRSTLARWLPLDQLKAVHRWIGHLLLAASLAHGAGYLWYFTTLEEPFTKVLLGTEPDLVRSMKTNMYEFVSDDDAIERVADWIAAGSPKDQFEAEIKPVMQEDCTKCHSTTSTMTYAIPSLPLSHYEQVLEHTGSGIASRQFRINFSGIAMLVLFAVVWASSLLWVRKRHHHQFQKLHRLGYIAAFLGLLHLPTLDWLIAPLVILAIELYLGRRQKLYKDCPARLQALSDELVRLEIDVPAGLNRHPGHYVQIRIPELGRDEWHPFSLTETGSSDRSAPLVLKIRKLGDWTARLQAMVPNGREHALRVDVRGAWASPVAVAPQRGDWLMVAGGIGVTPFMSLLHYVRQHGLGPQGPARALYLVWVLREPELIHWISPLVESLCQKMAIRVWFYLDNPEIERPNYWYDSGAADEAGSACERAIHLCWGRPDWDELLDGIELERRQRSAAEGEQRRAPTAFVCGPDGLARAFGRACRVRCWTLHEEQF